MSTAEWGIRGSPLITLRAPKFTGRYSFTGGRNGIRQRGGVTRENLRESSTDSALIRRRVALSNSAIPFGRVSACTANFRGEIINSVSTRHRAPSNNPSAATTAGPSGSSRSMPINPSYRPGAVSRIGQSAPFHRSTRLSTAPSAATSTATGSPTAGARVETEIDIPEADTGRGGDPATPARHTTKKNNHTPITGRRITPRADAGGRGG